MNIGHSLRHILIRIGIGLIDLLILTVALVYIYLGASPAGGIRLFASNALFIFLIVVVLYVSVVALTSILLTTMRQDSFFARLGKSIVATIIVVAMFAWFLPPLLWMFGYNLSADVDIRNTLIIASLVRSVFKVWAGRRYAGGAAGE